MRGTPMRSLASDYSRPRVMIRVGTEHEGALEQGGAAGQAQTQTILQGGEVAELQVAVVG